MSHHVTNIHVWQGGVPGRPDPYRGRGHQSSWIQRSVRPKRAPSRLRKLRRVPHYEACRNRRARPEVVMVPEVERSHVRPSGGEVSLARQHCL